jgi:hypothetical protein
MWIAVAARRSGQPVDAGGPRDLARTQDAGEREHGDSMRLEDVEQGTPGMTHGLVTLRSGSDGVPW